MSKKESVTCDYDGFEVAITDILNNIELDCYECLDTPIRENLKKGKNEVKAASPVKTGGYASGWTYTMSKKGRRNGVFGEIGNANKPGLVHLLEKGHAKVGGGFVAARPHVAPVADHIEQTLMDDIARAIEESL